MAKPKELSTTLSDTKLLKELIDSDQLSDEELEAFSGMLDGLTSGKFKKLTTNQKDWAEGVHCKLNLDPGTVNLVSSGQVKVFAKVLKYSYGPQTITPTRKIMYKTKYCSDCTWRCPTYKSEKCLPCRYHKDSPNFEEEEFPSYGTKAAAELKASASKQV